MKEFVISAISITLFLWISLYVVALIIKMFHTIWKHTELHTKRDVIGYSAIIFSVVFIYLLSIGLWRTINVLY